MVQGREPNKAEVHRVVPDGPVDDTSRATNHPHRLWSLDIHNQGLAANLQEQAKWDPFQFTFTLTFSSNYIDRLNNQ
jgi:hypothetical protein